jgi:hypothetical protein
MAARRRYDEQEDEEEAERPSEHQRELIVPDTLLAWAQEPSVASTMRDPLGRMAERLVRQGAREPLTKAETSRLLNLLDGIVGMALRAGRQELVLGFDTYTANLLNLHVDLTVNGKKVTVGRKGRWWFEEIALVQATDDPPAARDFVERVKDLFADVFPDARVSAVGRPQPQHCIGCGEEVVGGVLVEIEEREGYCRECWLMRYGPSKTETRPDLIVKKKRGEKRSDLKPEDPEQLGLLAEHDWD